MQNVGLKTKMWHGLILLCIYIQSALLTLNFCAIQHSTFSTGIKWQQKTPSCQWTYLDPSPLQIC